MPLCFQPRSHSSYDTVSGVSIPRPRILPTALGNGEEGTEYQYSFYRGDERIGGLGFEGFDEVVVHGEFREWVFTFDLGRVAVIKSMLRHKQDFGVTDDDFTFLHGLAQGLLLAYADCNGNDDNLRYVALTNVGAIQGAGVCISDDSLIQPDGKLVLAAVTVLANTDQRTP